MKEIIKLKKNRARSELIEMYIDSLNNDEIPWRKRWVTEMNVNGISNLQYNGINQLILNYASYKEKYNDNKWYTYIQIKEKNWKLQNAKNKGIPIEYWNVYDIQNKRNISFSEYQKLIDKFPDTENMYKVYTKISYVYNASLIDGVPDNVKSDSNIETSKYITKLIKKLKINYDEYGDKAFYLPCEDKVVLPKCSKFIDKYSYYATQLHEICHATGNEKRLNRNLQTNDKEQYAKEELIAEISSSFLMQKLNVDSNATHYDNHKSYIQSWIKILNDKPNELFKVINESNKICIYLENKIKEKEMER